MLYTHSICSFFHYNAHFIYLINYMYVWTHLLFLFQNNHYICIASILNVNFLSKHIMLCIPKSWKKNASTICHFIAIIELIMHSCLDVSMAYNNVSFLPTILFQMHLHTDWMSHTTKNIHELIWQRCIHLPLAATFDPSPTWYQSYDNPFFWPTELEKHEEGHRF